ncbi:putative amidohydrolase [Methanomicrobium sp. W14]|uniref:nitrilase-related carbon-nitrogen hydrolase n=1 Tax=Methanomicrobium sp. W14 TaxID=2817839 RepID=UPI001AE472B6|nr:nitrilase-related carbon-nitrogen hydrolase [Methanomicrobium sp. W14]MBP2134161.1 putative amidohydrolase [Methanomicrobium sp. W14]
MASVRICFAQAGPAWENPRKSMDKAGIYAKEASEKAAGIIIFPEQYATGWDPESNENMSGPDGFIPRTFRKIAEENNIAVLGSFREITEENTYGPAKPKNTSVFYDENGRLLAKYSKIHLFSPGNEDRFFLSGDMPAVFDYKGIRFGLSVCYDLRFSDLYSYYCKKGCECIFVQAAWPKKRMKHWRLFIHSRAVENQYFVAGVNTTGNTSVDEYPGGSLLVSPSGEDILEAGENEDLYYAEIDPYVVKETRKKFCSLSDRRDDLYIKWGR